MPNLNDKKYLVGEGGFNSENGNTWSNVLDIVQWKKDLATWAKEVYDVLNKEV